MEKKIGTIEVVTFRAKPTFSQEEVAMSLANLTHVVEGFDGFIRRQLSKHDDGTWMDLVYWESKTHALQAAAQVMKMPEAAEAFKVIDESTVQMNHFETVSISTN